MQPIRVPSDEDVLKTNCADSPRPIGILVVYRNRLELRACVRVVVVVVVVSDEKWSNIKNPFFF